MAIELTSNITRKLARIFLAKMETMRVLSKNVNTQLLKGRFDPSSGDKVDFKRPHDYRTVSTPTGDLSAESPSDITSGKATGTVQNYLTAYVDYDEAVQSIEMDQEEEILAPLATRLITSLELNFAEFMMKNTGVLSGVPGTPATSWDHVANAGAVGMAHGWPTDAPWFYTVNPFTQTSLASDQRSLGAGGSAGAMITEAHKKATIVEGFAGFDRVMTATTLPSYTTDADADRAGTLTANPDVTYLSAKDTMTQVLQVTAFGANLVVQAGETIQITGRNRLNLSTRKVILDASGNQILWTGTVVADVTLGGSGEGNLVVTGPAIFEATGAYNSVDSAPLSGDVITLLGGAGVIIQPNLFWHKQAFSIGFVPIKKLFSTDTIATTKDGLQIRVSKFSDGVKNQQTVRFDIRPAFAPLNPFLAGQGFA